MRSHLPPLSSSEPSLIPIPSGLLQQKSNYSSLAKLTKQDKEFDKRQVNSQRLNIEPDQNSATPVIIHEALPSPMPQFKLTVSRPGDAAELEADRIAQQVMQMPDSTSNKTAQGVSQEQLTSIQPTIFRRGILHRQPIEAPEEEEVENNLFNDEDEVDEEEEPIQSKEMPGRTPSRTPQVQAYVEGLHRRGTPLPESVRNFFESRFKYDFSQVKVHADSQANRTAHAMNALAFTRHRDVVFGAGQYAPDTTTGRQLLAHELVHVVQQGGAQPMQVTVPGQAVETTEQAATHSDDRPVQASSNRLLQPGTAHTSVLSRKHSPVSPSASPQVHTDPQAAATAQSMNAIAFTVRNHIYIPPGLDTPHTLLGRQILAHETAHAHQWQNGQTSQEPSWSQTQLEAEAERVAYLAARGFVLPVQGIYRGNQPLLHPIFISTHGRRGFLQNARNFYLRWGYGSPTSVSSIEEILEHLAGDTQPLDKVTIVSHAVPDNINISFLRGGPGFVLQSDWAVDTPREVAALAQHVMGEEFLREVHEALQADQDAEREMALLSRRWLTDSIVKQYLWWLVDTWAVNQLQVSRRRRRERTQVAALAAARLNTYRDILSVGMAVVGGLPSAQRQFSFTRFERLFNQVMARRYQNIDIQGLSLASARRTIQSRDNRLVDRIFTDLATGRSNFFQNLERVRARLSPQSHIEVQGCRVGRNRSYLQAMSQFFDGALVTAPNWFQIFGHMGFTQMRREGDRDFRSLWRRRTIRDALAYWYPVFIGTPLPANPDWQTLADYMRAGHPLVVGRRLLLTRSMSTQAFLEFLRQHGYRLNQDADIQRAFLRGRSLRQAFTFTLIDWLQEERGNRGDVIFRPDPEYQNHIIPSR